MARCGWCGRLIPATSALSVIARRRRDKPFWWPIAAGEAALGKYFSSLNSAEQDKLATAVRAAYVAGQPDGARSFTATAWACAGRVEQAEHDRIR